MKTRRATLMAGAVATLVALAGCGESVVPTVYEPGEYKGTTDPLLKKHATAEQKDLLKQRFAMSQSDR